MALIPSDTLDVVPGLRLVIKMALFDAGMRLTG